MPRRSVLAAIAVVVVLAGAFLTYNFLQTSEQERLKSEEIKRWQRTLVIASRFEPLGLDPGKLTTLAAAAILRQTYEGLVDYEGDTTKIKGVLAESWDVSSDGKVYTFRLRKGVKFHDGTSFNATAAKFGFERYLDVKKGLYYGTLSRLVSSIDVVDQTTLKITLKNPYGPFTSTLATLYMRIFISPSAIEKNKTPDDPWAAKWADAKVVGTGPYRLVSYTPGSDTVLEWFPDYWGKWRDNSIRNVIFRLVREASTQKQLLVAGEADIAENILVEDYKPLNQTQGIKITIDTTHPSAKRLLPMATFRPPLNDVRVRQAIAYAIDYDAIIRDVYGGLAVKMKGPFAPGVFPGLPGPYAKEYTRDVAKARTLMKEAGYSLDKPIKMKASNLPAPDNNRFFEIMQSNFREIGIDLEIDHVAGTVWSARASDPKQMTEFISYLGPTWYGDPDEISTNLHSLSMNPAGWNVARYNNSQVDALLEKARSITDYNERVKIYQEIERIVSEEVPFVWVAITGDYYTFSHRDWVQGRSLNPIHVRTLNIYDMWKTGKPLGTS